MACKRWSERCNNRRYLQKYRGIFTYMRFNCASFGLAEEIPDQVDELN